MLPIESWELPGGNKECLSLQWPGQVSDWQGTAPGDPCSASELVSPFWCKLSPPASPQRFPLDLLPYATTMPGFLDQVEPRNLYPHSSKGNTLLSQVQFSSHNEGQTLTVCQGVGLKLQPPEDILAPYPHPSTSSRFPLPDTSLWLCSAGTPPVMNCLSRTTRLTDSRQKLPELCEPNKEPFLCIS